MAEPLKTGVPGSTAGGMSSGSAAATGAVAAGRMPAERQMATSAVWSRSMPPSAIRRRFWAWRGRVWERVDTGSLPSGGASPRGCNRVYAFDCSDGISATFQSPIDCDRGGTDHSCAQWRRPCWRPIAQGWEDDGDRHETPATQRRGGAGRRSPGARWVRRSRRADGGRPVRRRGRAGAARRGRRAADRRRPRRRRRRPARDARRGAPRDRDQRDRRDRPHEPRAGAVAAARRSRPPRRPPAPTCFLELDRRDRPPRRAIPRRPRSTSSR